MSGLTTAEAERLALIVDECAKVIQAANGVFRHGYEDGRRTQLAKELGAFEFARALMCHHDVDEYAVRGFAVAAAHRKAEHLHQQKKQDLLAVKHGLEHG